MTGAAVRKDQAPRVSVIMTAYNEEERINRAVHSILNQDYRDFELIILDDGSTDLTWQLIEGFSDPRIVKVRLERLGFVRALNEGLRRARGEYLARMDADDESLSGRLCRQVEFLDTHPEIGVVGTGYIKIDGLRNERYVRSHPFEDEDIRRAMALYIPICHGSVMYRREVVETVGGYDESYLDAEDLDLWLRAAPHFRFANLSEPLYVYWFTPQHSYFETSFGRYKRTTNKLRLHARAIRQFGLPPHLYVLLAGTLIYNLLLPNSLKRLARKIVSRSQDLPISERQTGGGERGEVQPAPRSS